MVKKTGKVQRFRTRNVTHEAIQYVGGNGREVVAFLKKYGLHARNGGSYIRIMDGETPNILKTQFVVAESQGVMTILNATAFKDRFIIESTNDIVD